MIRFPMIVREGEGGGAAGSAGGTGAVTGGNAGGGNAGGGDGKPWYSSIQDEATRGFIELKGFKDIGALVEGYKNIEKLRGIPEARLVTIPEKDDDKTGVEAMYKKLGRPDSPDGYEVPVPEGQSDEFAKWARGQFHSLGLSKKQGEALAKAWNDKVTADSKRSEETAANALNDQVRALKAEWGSAAETNADIVDKLCESIGLDTATQKKIEGVMGFDGFAKMMHGIATKFGIKFGDPKFETGNGTGGFQGAPLSPAAAQQAIEELKSDPEWRKSYLEGNKDAANKLMRLQRWSLGM